MEKVLFVVRSLKEKLVINLESLLLHGNEDFREKILKREEKRRKSQNKAHMARRGNPISVRRGMSNFGVRIFVGVFLVFILLTLSYGLFLLLGLDYRPVLEKLQSMLLLRSFRCLFSRLLGWELPLILLLCLVSGLGGSTLFHMLGSESASAAAAPSEPSENQEGGWTSLLGSTAQQPSVVPSGRSPAGVWTHFDEDVLLGSSSGHSNSSPSVNQPQPGEQAMPPANPVASGEAEAGPSHVLPFPYDDEEVIGGDSVLSIQQRLLAKKDFPSAHEIAMARIEAQDRFEIKVDIIRQMTPLDPEGDWERRGARALDNPRTLTGEDSLEGLHFIYDKVCHRDPETINNLKEKMVFRRRDEDSSSVT